MTEALLLIIARWQPTAKPHHKPKLS